MNDPGAGEKKKKKNTVTKRVILPLLPLPMVKSSTHLSELSEGSKLAML